MTSISNVACGQMETVSVLLEEMQQHIFELLTDKELLPLRQVLKRFRDSVDVLWGTRDSAFKKVRYSSDPFDYVRDKFLYSSMKKYFLLIAKNLGQNNKAERENIAQELKIYIEKNKISLPTAYLECLEEAFQQLQQDLTVIHEPSNDAIHISKARLFKMIFRYKEEFSGEIAREEKEKTHDKAFTLAGEQLLQGFKMLTQGRDYLHSELNRKEILFSELQYRVRCDPSLIDNIEFIIHELQPCKDIILNELYMIQECLQSAVSGGATVAAAFAPHLYVLLHPNTTLSSNPTFDLALEAAVQGNKEGIVEYTQVNRALEIKYHEDEGIPLPSIRTDESKFYSTFN